MLNVVVDWYDAQDEEDRETRCVYAYVHPTKREILYIGKADFSSARERWNDHERDGVFEFFENELGLERWDTILGEIVEVDGMSRLSVELLIDIETLLLWHVHPPGNAQIPEPNRPALRVTCVGEWPMEESVFEDPS